MKKVFENVLALVLGVPFAWIVIAEFSDNYQGERHETNQTLNATELNEPESIESILTEYRKERIEIEELLEDGTLSQEQAELIFAHMIARADIDIVKAANLDTSNSTFLSSISTLEVLRIVLVGGLSVDLPVQENQSLDTVEQVLEYYKSFGFEDDQNLTVNDIESFATDIHVDASVDFSHEDLEEKVETIIRLLDEQE